MRTVSVDPKVAIQFKETLASWYATHKRALPWKESKDPYLIWLSEIILQQTRVDQGLPYFQRFKARFPKVEDLAAAALDEVLKLWEGLGYYTRARNLHHTARFIAEKCGGKFPDTYEDLLKLKGVGPYSAAAIASFAFDLPHAVVDGNVCRVLGRHFGIDAPIDRPEGRDAISAVADALLDTAQPGPFNQALMDFGATWCTPRNPKCGDCPFGESCAALQQQRVNTLPYKAVRREKKERFFYYLALNYQEEVLIHQRTASDIWQKLYEFLLIELPQPAADRQAIRLHPTWQHWVGASRGEVIKISPLFRQTLTHQKITAEFWEIRLSGAPIYIPPTFRWVQRKNLPNFAFPKIIDWYLGDN